VANTQSSGGRRGAETGPVGPAGKTEATHPLPTKVTRPLPRGVETAPIAAVQQTRPTTPLMTDGMKAHRREIERRKRTAAVERLAEEEETIFRRRRLRSFTVWAILALIAGWAYWRVQILHQNQWPLMDVWITMSIALLACFAWILWYFNRGEL
jgi:hypothetical protein